MKARSGAAGRAHSQVMGFDPYRQQPARRTSDYVLVAAAVLVVVALLAWAVLG